MGLKITGLGKALPSRIVTNDDMGRIVDTNDEWIAKRTGIRQRRFTGEGEDHLSLSVMAAENALADAGVSADQIGLVIEATTTASQQIPSAACRVMEKLQIPGGIPAFDIAAACTGFIYALKVTEGLADCLTGERPYALVIGVDEMSSILDFTDRSTCILFGDGGGAAVCRLDEGSRFFAHLAADGNSHTINVPCKVQMDGQAVFRFAVRAAQQEIGILENLSGVSVQEIDYLVCHQANSRILDYIRRKLKLPEEKVFQKLQYYGNMSAGSIPLALAEMKERGLLSPGKRIFAVGFGAGMSWGGVYLEF